MQNNIELCKNCTKSKRDLKLGLICSETGQKPDFEKNCPIFDPTEEYLERIKADKPIVTVTTKWKCNNCGEINEDSFELCWNCQTERSNECEIIEEKHIGKSKNELIFEKKIEKGSGKRFIIEGFLVSFWVGGFAVLINSFFGWHLTGINGKVLPDEPETMFVFLILYDVLYLINYFTFNKDVRHKLGFSMFTKGIIINAILIIFFLIGIAIT